MAEGLKHGPLTDDCVHLCVDMQNLFARKTDWHTPSMSEVVPNVARIVERAPGQTIFTRFIPAQRSGEGEGTWRRYYERWASMTLEQLPPEMIELVPELARFAPPAEVIDKKVYSPWFQPELAASLARRRANTLVITGGETDVCVLATVLGAVDRGYRIIVVGDCLCSSSDKAHEASITLYDARFGQQIEVVSIDTLMEAWRPRDRPAPGRPALSEGALCNV